MLGYFNSLADPTHGASTDLVIPATEQHEGFDPWWYNLTACWNASDPLQAPGCHYQNVKWPMILSAGWWDIFHAQELDGWQGIRTLSDPSVRDKHVLIVGPLGHCIGGTSGVSSLVTDKFMLAEADGLVVGGELSSEFWKWEKCTNEWAIDNHCKCEGRVRFGKGDIWSEPKSVSGSIKCDTNNFDDPLPGKAKECQCQEATGTLRRRIGRVNLFIMGGFAADIPLPVAGAPGNYWTSLDDWPATSMRDLFLQDNHVLGTSAPDSSASATYTYDPSDPAPMAGGNNLPAIGKIHYCGSADQLSREARSDVLTFDSEPLTEDTPLVGMVSATLYVSSSAVDTDFIVTLDDLNADKSKSMLIRYGMQRMRWRDSEVDENAPMENGQVYEVRIRMEATGYIVPKGHMLRVSVSSAAAPYYHPTSNTGKNDMIETPDPVIAENTVHFAPDYPSRVTLPVVRLDDIPENPHFNAIGPFMQSSEPIETSTESMVV